MDAHNKRIAVFYKYRKSFLQTSGAFVGADLTDKQWDNIQKFIASTATRDSVVGFLDTSLSNNGKSGCLFTDEKIYYLEAIEKPQKIWYDEIDHIKVAGEIYEQDNERFLRFFMKDGTKFEWQNPAINKTPVGKFILENLRIDQEENRNAERIFYTAPETVGATVGGLAAGAHGAVNKSYDEERFHSRQGHGFAAERANTLYDQMTGHKAKIVGDDNAKNGADRIVDGINIQSKYCATGSRCVKECFENNGNGIFRYMTETGPMEIEVPSDVYGDAVQAMENKIRNGQVPGVTDPKEAAKIIRKGHFTYRQAVNIAKAGKIESIIYDSVNGIVIGSSAFGISAMITFATSFWSGETPEICLQRAAFSGLKVGGVTFLAVVLGGQLSKAGLNSLLVGGSERIISALGPKASAVLINAFRDGGKAIYGAAAMKSAAKLLRGNVITGAVTFALLSSADVARLFCGRISGKQLFKNLLCTTASIGGGSAGTLVGATVGSAVMPGVGTVVGSIVGAMAAGTTSEKVVHAAVDQFLEDDANEMVDILQDVFAELSQEYLLNAKEAEKCVDALGLQLTGSILRDMFASNDRKAFAASVIRPIMESRVSKRTTVHIPSCVALTQALKTALENIGDQPSPCPV